MCRVTVIGHLIAHPRHKLESTTILQLGIKLTFENQDDVTLVAPMIGKRRGGDAANASNDYRAIPLGAGASLRWSIVAGAEAVVMLSSKG